MPQPILIVWRDPGTRFPALVDSGSDATCLSLQIALMLGVQFDPNVVEDGVGAGGMHSLFRATEDFTLQSACGPIHLTKPSINPALPFILLGRTDFFAQYQVTFNHRDSWFQVDRYPPTPPQPGSALIR
jgi:hypothetical protein